MLKTSNSTFYITYKVDDVDLEQLRRLVKEIKSVTGMKPVRILDKSDKQIDLN